MVGKTISSRHAMTDSRVFLPQEEERAVSV